MVNEYDAIADEMFVQQKDAPVSAGPVNEYDAIAEEEFGANESQFDQAQFVAKDKEPERVTEAMKLAEKHGVPVHFVEQNLESFQEKEKKPGMSHGEIVEKSPQLGKYMEDPYQAAAIKDDIENLSGAERNLGRIKSYDDQPGIMGSALKYGGELRDAGYTGFANLDSSGQQLAVAFGMTDIDKAADSIADKNKMIKAAQSDIPKYATEFAEYIEKEGGDVQRGFDQWMLGYDQLREGKIIDGLGNYAAGNFKTLGEAVDFLAGTIYSHKKAVLRSSAESLAFSYPALVTGFAAGKVGAVGGTLVGGPVGTAVGGTAGFAAGTFAGSSAVEVGAWINQSLEERGYDITNADDLRKAYKNKELMGEIRGEAIRKGVTTAGIDALSSVFAGKILKGAVAGSKVSKGLRMGGELGVQAGFEGLSEGGGQLAAYGDISKVSVADVLTEAVVSGGHTIAEGGLKNAVTKSVEVAKEAKVKRSIVGATEELVENYQNAKTSVDELQALEQLGEIAKVSKVLARDPKLFAKIIAKMNVDGGGEQAVYFQKEQWDGYWQSKGESPVQKAEELLGGDSYDTATESGQPISIPMSEYIAQMGDKPEFGEIIQMARTKPDGMTLSESRETFQKLPEQMDALAQDAKVEQEFRQKSAESLKVLKERLESQLVAAGRDKIEALPLLDFYRVLGINEGIDPLELADKYGLNINAVDGTQAQSGETVLDQKVSRAATIKGEIEAASGTELGLQFSDGRYTRGESYQEDEYGDLIFQNPDSFMAPNITGETGKRALEAGFDLENAWYHGSKGDIESFSDDTLGSSTGAGSARLAHFFASSPTTASDYADASDSKLYLRSARTEAEATRMNDEFKARMKEKYGSKWTSKLDAQEKSERAGIKKMQQQSNEDFKNSQVSEGQAGRLKDNIEQQKRNIEYIKKEIKEDAPAKKIKAYEKALDFAKELAAGEWIKGPKGRGFNIKNKETGEFIKNPGLIGRGEAAEIIHYAWPQEMERRIAGLEKRVSETSLKSLKSKLKTAEKDLVQMEVEYSAALDGQGGEVVYQTVLKLQDPLVVDFAGAPYREVTYREILEKAEAHGYDGVIFQNTFDPAFIGHTREDELIDVAAVFKADQIRSVHAKFQDLESNKILAQSAKFEDGNSANIYDQDQRARIRFLGNNKSIIELFKKADKSSLFHETGHYFLEVLKDMASMDSASQGLKDDFQAILDWMGVESADQITTEHHEKWARGFEAYLREGKAPSSKMRKAFNTFKVWLTEVYRSAKQLNVEMSPEITGVMDRMLATEEEIEQSRQGLGDFPLYTDPIASGMTEAKAAKYNESIAEAEMTAKEELLKKEVKALERRKKIKDKINYEKIVEELKLYPAYNAIEVLKSNENLDGNPPLKLDYGYFNQMFSEIVKNKQKFSGMFADDGTGLHPDMVATILGFESGTDMIVQIDELMDRKKYIEMRAEQITDEQFKEEESTLEEKADAALHNMGRAKRLRMEYEHLSEGLKNDATRKVARRPAPDSQMRETAAKIIKNMAVSKIKPNQYRLAERRYAKEAGEMLAAKDIEAAFLAKERELLNHYLYKEAQAAKVAIKKAEKNAKKFFDKDDKLAKTRDMDLIQAARAILARYGLGNAKESPLDLVAKIKEYNPDAYESVAAIVTALVNDPDNYQNITYERLVDLNDGVNSIWNLAKDIKEVTVDGEKVSIQKAINEMDIATNVFRKDVGQKKYNETSSQQDKWRVKILGMRSAFKRFENWVDTMDMGNIDGPFRKYLWTPVSEALDNYYDKRAQMKKRLLELSKPMQNRPEYLQEIVATELKSDGKAHRFRNKYELLGALLHSGNDSNKKKLLIGYGWGMLDEDGNLATRKWDQFIERMHKEGILTKEDYDYVQSLWDIMEEIKPMAQKAHYKINGFYFNEITAQEIKTPFGTYRGGYAPAAIDPYVVTDIARRAQLEQFMKSHPNFMWPAGGGSGMTKNRVDNFNKPLSLDVSLVGNHIGEALRYAMVKPAVVDAAKIATNADFKAMLGDIDPVVIDEMIIPSLNRADKDQIYSEDGKAVPILSGLANTLRQNAAMQLMFMNIKNTAEQIAGLAPAQYRIGGGHLTKANAQFLRNPREVAAMIYEKSAAMRTRSDDMMFHIEKQSRAIFKTATTMMEKGIDKYNTVNDWGTSHAYFTQAAFQNQLDNVVWLGSYNAGIANGLTEQSAIRKADSDIRLTQTSRRSVDVAQIETHRWLNFFNMFYSFFLQMGNLNVSAFQKIYHSDMGMSEKGRAFFYSYLMNYATIAMVSAVISKGASGGLDEDGDDEYSDDLFDVMIGSQIEFGFAMVPIIGPGMAAGYQEIKGDKPFMTRVSASPAAAAVGVVGRAVGKLGKGELTDNDLKNAEIRDSLSALGILTGLPIGPAAKPINYYRDVQSGEAKPTGPIDALRGALTGKPGVK